MSQRTKILTQIVGFRGWKVAEHRWESRDGAEIAPAGGYDVPADARLVLVLERRWAPRCAKCLAIGGDCHEKLGARQWEQSRLRRLFRLNGKLARAYQLKVELRAVLRAPTRQALYDGLWRILRRTERRDNVPMRKLHESLKDQTRSWSEVGVGETRRIAG